jgi:tripartite-type tricarboxylate transporter receptor subunit TctC
VLLVQQRLGLRATAVAFRGTAAARQEMLAGRFEMVCEPVRGALATLRAGLARPVPTTGAGRAAGLPETPTLAEAFGPGPDLWQFYGVLAPRGTPPPVIARLVAAIEAMLEDPAGRARFGQAGAQVVPPAQPGPAAQQARIAADARAFRVRPK